MANSQTKTKSLSIVDYDMHALLRRLINFSRPILKGYCFSKYIYGVCFIVRIVQLRRGITFFVVVLKYVLII